MLVRHGVFSVWDCSRSEPSGNNTCAGFHVEVDLEKFARRLWQLTAAIGSNPNLRADDWSGSGGVRLPMSPATLDSRGVLPGNARFRQQRLRAIPTDADADAHHDKRRESHHHRHPGVPNAPAAALRITISQ